MTKDIYIFIESIITEQKWKYDWDKRKYIMSLRTNDRIGKT